MEHQFSTTRTGLTRKFTCGLDVYLTVNLKPDGEPGEIFIKLGKQGSTLSTLMHTFAITVSAALQRGVPWADLREKYIGHKCEPYNFEYTSLVDAIAKNVEEMVSILHERCEKHRLNFDFDPDEGDSDDQSQR